MSSTSGLPVTATGASTNSLLEKLGLLLVALVVLRFTRTIIGFTYRHLLGPSVLCRGAVDFAKCGKWAVVTGATDGLGKAYATQLAGKGMDVVLVSRTQSKLDATALEIAAKHPNSRVKTVRADFADADTHATYSRVANELYGLDVGVLVNNVGLSYPHPQFFLDAAQEQDKENALSGFGPQLFDDIVKCNVTSVLNMCRIVMPGMVERGRGCVINIGSTVSRIPCPLLTVYGATKKFVEKFSQELSTEYSRLPGGKRIVVQCVMPGYVATKMSKISRASWMVPTPDTFVKSALQTTGIEAVTTGYLPHTLMVRLMEFAESISQSFMSGVVMKNMLTVRQRAIRKQQRERQAATAASE